MDEKYTMYNTRPPGEDRGDLRKHCGKHPISELCAVYGCWCVGYEAPEKTPPWTPAVGEWVRVRPEKNHFYGGWETWVKRLDVPGYGEHSVALHCDNCGSIQVRPEYIAPLWDGNYDPPELEQEYDGKMIPIHTHGLHEEFEDAAYWYYENGTQYIAAHFTHNSGFDDGAGEVKLGFLPSEAGSVWSENKDGPTRLCSTCMWLEAPCQPTLSAGSPLQHCDFWKLPDRPECGRP